ncbi:MAG TPA: energy transducer TonB [Candidatus Didemnitutus sp.]|nr:energy transducer TonB [Candidatus Didemnitutus sp.]
MIRALRLLLCSGLLAAGLAPVLRAAPDEDNVGVAIHQTGRVLVFPPDLLTMGVSEGEVQVVLSVDAEGKLTDLLVVSYTNPAFAEAVEKVLPTWTYDPARLHGRAQAGRVDIDIKFSSEVNIFVVNLGWHYWENVTGGHRFVYKTYKLSDLDRIPTPAHVVRPGLPNGAAPSSDRTVTVEFFIDEYGRVRVPTVDRTEASDSYAAAAIAAVEQWKFEPPVRHGKPVLVLLQEDFTFRAKR